MSVLTSFLENSSIHGLGFIAQTRAFARVFWVLVVIMGFTLASHLIMTNFDNWAENPVITNMETLPISEVPFPRVTVCPPKNTFTDLNYDLLMTENVTLTEEMRTEMFKYVVEVLIEDIISQKLVQCHISACKHVRDEIAQPLYHPQLKLALGVTKVCILSGAR